MSFDQQPKMFDGKMIMAIALTLFMWVAYQSYLQKKYPEAYKNKKVATTEQSAVDKPVEASGLPTNGAGSMTKNNSGASQELVPKEEYLDYSVDNLDIRFTSKGMALSKIVLTKRRDREERPIQFLSTDLASNFETNIVGRRTPLFFQMEQTLENQITGVATLGEMKITKVINIEPESYLFNVNIIVENADKSFSGLITKISSRVKETEGGSFIGPGLNYQEYYVNYDEGTEDRLILEPDSPEKESFSKVSIAALASQYFALALVNESDVLPEFQGVSYVDSKGTEPVTSAVGVLTHSMLNPSNTFRVSYKAYAGPKSWDILTGINPELGSIINFGFFKTIAHWIFQLLRIIHAAVGNWGYAIILLTLLVRALVFPFNFMSYKSMKAMAKVQPEIKAIRDKYKSDPQRANQEIMSVMKEAKANPLGGCLPMFLQIPVFFALYQVLGQAIELYKAPFVLWISDLSQYDPFFIFPVGMGVTMFIQQKITPSTLEPAQQKILMAMPIFLTVLLATLPSGLTLYMFISTLFGVLQQFYFMKGDSEVSGDKESLPVHT